MGKVILFDLHGTLLLSDDIEATWDRWFDAFFDWMVSHGVTTGVDECRHEIQSVLSWNPPVKEKDSSTFMLQIRALCEKYGFEPTREEIGSFADRLISIWYEDIYLDPDAHFTLRRLRENHRLGLVSNWNHSPSLYVTLGRYDLEEYFDAVVVSDDVGVLKPDPLIFEEALGRLGVEPSDAVYVGDDPVDYEGSLAAGLQPVVIRRSGAGYWDISLEKRFDESLNGAIVINNLRELLDIF